MQECVVSITNRTGALDNSKYVFFSKSKRKY